MSRIKSGSIAIVGLLMLCTSPIVIAGPLDRTDMGPRVNPATNNMLRVPGVIGMDAQSAMATLQQAGLNPQVHTIQSVSKKYAGREGTVVKQLPLAGGMAMLGSSVSITVYAPGNMTPSQVPSADGTVGPYDGDSELQTPDMGSMQSPGMDDTDSQSGTQGGDQSTSPGNDNGNDPTPGASGTTTPSPDPQADTGNAATASPDQSDSSGVNWGTSPSVHWRPKHKANAPTLPARRAKPEGQKYLSNPQQGAINP